MPYSVGPVGASVGKLDPVGISCKLMSPYTEMFSKVSRLRNMMVPFFSRKVKVISRSFSNPTQKDLKCAYCCPKNVSTCTQNCCKTSHFYFFWAVI